MLFNVRQFDLDTRLDSPVQFGSLYDAEFDHFGQSGRMCRLFTVFRVGIGLCLYNTRVHKSACIMGGNIAVGWD